MNSPSSPIDPVASKTTRRLVLGGALTAGVAAVGWHLAKSTGIAPVAVTTAQTPKPQAPPEIPAPHFQGRDAFAAELNTEFAAAEGSTTLRLIRVSEETTSTGKPGTFATYSLVFKGPESFMSEGGICELTHERLGPMAFFLSPIERPQKGERHLEAIFSRKV